MVMTMMKVTYRNKKDINNSSLHEKQYIIKFRTLHRVNWYVFNGQPKIFHLTHS